MCRLPRRKPLLAAVLLVWSAASAAGEMVDELLVVDVNRQGSSEAVVLLRGDKGERYATAADFGRWRLRVPDVAPLMHEGVAYYPLAAMDGLSYRLNEATQVLELEVAASAFLPTTLEAGRQRKQSSAPTAPPGRGAFLNYDLYAENTQYVKQASALLDLGVFNTYGTGTLSALARHAEVDGGYVLGDATTQQFVRLDTAWAVDNPEAMTSLRIGDTQTRPASQWGRSVLFGGVQYATNFATNPYLITFPLQGVSGEAVLPSTMDLYINNVLASRRDVPPGPFSINDLPTTSGLSDVQVVVRDVLGREQVFTMPVYTTPALLRPGLQDFSYEAGVVRENYGLRSNDYGRWLASASHRVGFTDYFTGEAHVELMQRQATLGVGAALRLGEFGVLGAQVVGSERNGAPGGLLNLVFDRRTNGLSFGGLAQFATRDFIQIGMNPDDYAPEWRAGANVSYASKDFGTFGLLWLTEQLRTQVERGESVSVSYSISLGRTAFLSLTATQVLSGEQDFRMFATLTVPFGERSNASLSSNYTEKDTELRAQVQQSLPAGEGWGYRVAGSDNGNYNAEGSVQTSTGRYSAEVARRNDIDGVRLNGTGALALLEGSLHATRRIDGSFGLVQVPGYENVRVYSENQLVGRTDENGNFILPRLRPYERNRVSIDQADLPLDATVDALALDAIPYYRSAAVVPFPVKPSNAAEITIVLADGRPLPSGAVVKVGENGELFPVAMQGRVYLTGLSAENVVHVTLGAQSCVLNVAFKQSDDPIPDLGSFVCEGISP